MRERFDSPPPPDRWSDDFLGQVIASARANAQIGRARLNQCTATLQKRSRLWSQPPQQPPNHGWVITARDITDEANLTSRLRHQALHDVLTGLPNRALLLNRITHALDRLDRSTETFVAVALVDLDDIKAVNDTLGHDKGDELLCGVAARLAEVVRPRDTVRPSERASRGYNCLRNGCTGAPSTNGAAHRSGISSLRRTVVRVLPANCFNC